MDKAYGWTGEYRTILEIAESLREEFGVVIDVHPGGDNVEAGQINRAFCVMSKCVLSGMAPTEDALPGLLTLVLQGIAERRLEAAGVLATQAAFLLDQGTGNPWYAYLALAPPSVIQDLLEGSEPNNGGGNQTTSNSLLGSGGKNRRLSSDGRKYR